MSAYKNRDYLRYRDAITVFTCGKPIVHGTTSFERCEKSSTLIEKEKTLPKNDSICYTIIDLYWERYGIICAKASFELLVLPVFS